MKISRIIIAIILCLTIGLSFASCATKTGDEPQITTTTETSETTSNKKAKGVPVTDKNGKEVTDKNGNVVTEIASTTSKSNTSNKKNSTSSNKKDTTKKTTTKKKETTTTTIPENRNLRIRAYLPYTSDVNGLVTSKLTIYVVEKVKDKNKDIKIYEEDVELNGGVFEYTTPKKYSGNVKIKITVDKYTIVQTIKKGKDLTVFKLSDGTETISGEDDK